MGEQRRFCHTEHYSWSSFVASIYVSCTLDDGARESIVELTETHEAVQ